MDVPVLELQTPAVLVAVEEGPRALISVGTDTGVVRFVLDADGARVRLGLQVPGRERSVDVSDRPHVLTREIGEGESVQVARWASSFCLAQGQWGGGGDDLGRALGGAAFPLLGAVYDEGASTLEAVPRWAAPALAERQVAAAARAALGQAGRRLVAALGASLRPVVGEAAAPSPAPNLFPLALAVMGRPVLAPDGLARVLQAGADHRPCEPAGWPTVDGIVRFQQLAPGLGARRVERVLTDAARVPDGARVLARTVSLLPGLPSGARLRLPIGLVALHDRCRDLTPIDPGLRDPARPLPGRPPERPPRAAEPPPRRAPRAPRHALRAPVEARRPPTGRLEHPPAVARLHGHVPGPRLRLVVPRSTEELRQWGVRLHSCIGSFAAASVSGRSLLLGVERDDLLTYCAEITPASRTIRQFLGPHNRAVPPTVAAPVVSVLVAAGLVDPRHPVNRPWMAICAAAPPP